MPVQQALLAILPTLTLFLAQPTLSQTDRLHAVIVGDTNDQELSLGVRVNIERYEALAREIASATSRTSNVQVIKGNDFNCSNIIGALNALTMGPKDIVMFFYAGHGFRVFGQRSRFPRLWCNATTPAGTPLLEDITMALWTRAPQPRLVFSMADACNADLGAPPPQPADDAAKVRRKEAMTRLFAEHRGTLLLAGADMGEFSWYNVLGTAGGQFTLQLMRSLEEEFDRGKQASWDRVITQATRAFQTLYGERMYIQRPIHDSTLRFAPN